MRKTSILILVCFLLGVIAFYTWSKKNSTLGISENSFRLSKPGSVTEIHLSSETNKIILMRSGNHWKLESEAVNDERIRDMLIISSKIEVLAPAPVSTKDTLTEKMKNGISIAYLMHHKTLLTFRICRLNNQVFGRLNHSKKIYRIGVTGYPDLDLQKVFDPSPESWKSNILFNIAPANIRSISISYPNRASHSFRIIQPKKDSLILTGFPETDTITNVDKEALKEYLYFFSDIRYVSRVDKKSLSSIDSLKEENFFSLKIISSSNDTVDLNGYRKSLSHTGEKDLFQFNGMTKDENVFLLNYNDFDAILVPGEYFRKK